VLALHPAGAETELDPPTPPEMWSTVATAFASRPGSRKVAGETSVPSRSVVVRAASAASVVHASCATFALSFDCEM
jgi:hypothetical protein